MLYEICPNTTNYLYPIFNSQDFRYWLCSSPFCTVLVTWYLHYVYVVKLHVWCVHKVKNIQHSGDISWPQFAKMEINSQYLKFCILKIRIFLYWDISHACLTYWAGVGSPIETGTLKEWVFLNTKVGLFRSSKNSSICLTGWREASIDCLF